MTEPYIPKEAIDIKETSHLFRIGIQGAPKTGKTWAALTFPNPVVLDFDNNLRGFSEVYPEKKILSIPFWKPEFCDSIAPRTRLPTGAPTPANRRDALRVWLDKNITKFQPGQTVIWDSFTRGQDGFDQQQDLEPQYTKGGTIDEFAFWRLKQEYTRDILNWLNTANCDVIVIFHETGERNAAGLLTGKLKPMMEGKFCDKLAGYFTDWFRQVVVEEEDKDNKGNVIGKTRHYYWQTKGDNIANCGTSLRKLDIKNPKGFVPATYESLIKP